MTPFARRQFTIERPVSVSGFGFWSGRDVTLDFHPAADDSGIVFVRRDLPGCPRIAATLQNRIPGPRRTTLRQNGADVEMVEHVIAALAGLQIDNCEISLDAAELPGMDGSSEPFVQALLSAGHCQQHSWRPRLIIETGLKVCEDEAWIEALADDAIDPRLQPELSYQIDYPDSPVIGQQIFTTRLDRQTFINEIAPARTFVLQSEAEQLKRQGLGTRVSYQDVLVFDSTGPIENELRFPNECARHKTLDMIGDFALTGHDLVGRFSGYRSGHHLNAMLMARLTAAHLNLLTNKQSA